MTLNNLLYEIGKWMGVVGFTFLSVLIFSGDTARFFDRLFGLDKIIRFQKKFSYYISIFILMHPIFFIISGTGLKEILIPDFVYLALSLGIIGFYIFATIMVASYLHKFISYKLWQYLHFLNYILFGFVLYHSIFWGSDLENLKILYFILTIMVFIGLIYRTIYKIKNAFSGKFIIDKITKENEDIYTVTLKAPKKIKYIAGQFAFLRINKKDIYTRHPFTFSSSPNEENVSFTIKKSGLFTKTVETLDVGCEIKFDGPFGKFTPDYKKDLVLIAGGVGITPFISIIKDRLYKDKNQNIILLYAVRNEKDLIFKKFFDSINKNWFKVIYILSAETNDKYYHGYIDENLIKENVKNIDSLFYICGPEPMKKSLINIIKNSGFNKKNIFSENFFW
jgi:predicted ferric reductase